MPAWPAWAGERMPNPDSSHFALGLCPRPAGSRRNRGSTLLPGALSQVDERGQRGRVGTPFTEHLVHASSVTCSTWSHLLLAEEGATPLLIQNSRGLEGPTATSCSGGIHNSNPGLQDFCVFVYHSGLFPGYSGPQSKALPMPGKPQFHWPAMPGPLTLPSRAGGRGVERPLPAFLPHCPMGCWEKATSGKIVTKEEQ